MDISLKKNIITTDRLTVRRIRTEDWKAIQALWQDFTKSEYYRYDCPMDTDDEAVFALVSRWDASSDSLEHMLFAVCLSDQLIGYVCFNQIEDGYELGYSFHSAYHRKGYAKESISALLEYLRSLGVKRVEAGTALKNTPSVGLLYSLDFKRIGTEDVSFFRDDEGNRIYFRGGVYEIWL